MKNNWSAGDLENAFGKQYEFMIYASKGLCKIRGKRFTDVWCFDRVAGNDLVHQNQKPIPLLKQAISSLSDEGDLIFDGFMGSGSTGIACKQLNRSFIGFEIDDEYFRIAQERIEKGIATKSTENAVNSSPLFI